ncbi:unnamed protein product [Pieris brassicae]|uniref:Uncharacterized protein n=1 Tax=Pieris brassicae TaxID=7116 RepID=A0A9P0XAL5_PIEBR|nr:unnamed protein product [Pieris brassicae]
MATLDHYCSTDELPRHDNCPEVAESWCEWRKAETTNTLAAFKHPPRLIDEHVEKHIRPVYEDLSKDELITSMAYLAVKSLQRLADEEQSKFPVAAHIA